MTSEPAAFRNQIDRCEFRIIRLYVESQHSQIKAAFVVDRSIRLEQVAVVAAFGDDRNDAKSDERRISSNGSMLLSELLTTFNVTSFILSPRTSFSSSNESRLKFWPIVGDVDASLNAVSE